MFDPRTPRLTTLADAPGRPVLLVGPSMGTSARGLWARAVEHLDAHVVAWDLPGHDGAPPQHHPLTLEELADAILDQLDHPDFHATGDSIGGAVALLLAAHAPERVRSVAVVCSTPTFGTPDAWHDRARTARDESMAPIVEATPARWFGPDFLRDHPDRADAALADLAAVDQQSYAHLCEALAVLDLTAVLPTITAPTLHLAGELDRVSTPDQMAEAATRMPDAWLEVLPGVGHLAPLEAPTATAAALARTIRLGEERRTRPA